MTVIEAGVSRFCRVEVAVEGLHFDTDFGDEVAGEMGGEGGRVAGRGIGEEAMVVSKRYQLCGGGVEYWL